MDLRDEQKRPKRPARSRARTRLIEEDAETEASYGSMETSGTESPLPADDSSNTGDTTPVAETPIPAVSAFNKPGLEGKRKSLKTRQNSSELDVSKRRSRSEQSRSHRQLAETGKFANVYNELSDVGLPLDVSVADVFDEPDRAIFAHHCCAAWNDGVLQAEDYSLQYVDKFAFAGLSSKCSFCDKYGGTIPCKAPKCTKKFHYPCASGSGCFQDVKTFTLLCPDHLDLAEATAKDESYCVACNEPGDIQKQLFCTSCGQHYHGDCLQFEIECNTVVRAGWQCPECKVCQECRKPGDDNKMLVCDVCDKGFHTFCLVPAISKVPSNGWRCHNCRLCVDCGLRTSDMRLSKNFTNCNSCHMMKSRGPSCPVCRKAYKLANVKAMTHCTTCKRYVHNSCDKEIEKTDVKKYQCPICILGGTSAAVSPAPEKSADNLIAEVSIDDVMEHREGRDTDSEMADSEKMSVSSTSSRVKPVKPGKGKPASFTRGKVCIKKPPNKSSRSSSTATSSRSKGKVMKKRSRPPASRDHSKRPKNKENIATTHSTAPSAESVKKMDDDDQHAAVVLAATSDLFVLTQDMCMSCGSYGKDTAADLITCTQCGQCYHPFCVQVKVNEVMLTKGWRCLDCTVCEGCGKPTDEPKLLLCDECDISFHIYCLDPPLTQVPKGNWKCKWCVHCRYCGSADPGFGCAWINNYTECGPCHSVTDCPVCEQCYMDNELVIQCNQCQRWLHASCDNMKTEEDAEKMSAQGYHCVFCRPKTGAVSPRPATPDLATPSPITSPVVPVVPKEEEKAYSVDGIVLSENGLDLIKELSMEPPPLLTVAQRAAHAARMARNRQMKIKQTHPQMSQLLGVPSETTVDEDTASNTLDESTRSATDLDGGQHTPNTDSVLSPSAADVIKTESWQQRTGADGQHMPMDASQTADGQVAADANKSKKRIRKAPPLGIGGFIAKLRHNRAPPKPVVHGPHTADGQPPMLMKDASTADTDAAGDGSDPSKKRFVRKQRKKGIIEDTYPMYLQEAFFGKDTLEQTKQGVVHPSAIVPEPSFAFRTSNISLNEVVPENCTIKLAEGVRIPSPQMPQMFPSILPSTSDHKDNAQDDVQPIDGDDLDILPGVSGDMLPAGLHEEELYKIFDDIQSEEGREAGPVDSKSSLRASEDAEMDIDTQNLEDFLKGIMENDASAEAAAGVLSDLPVDGADAVTDPMDITPAITTNPPPMQQIPQALSAQAPLPLPQHALPQRHLPRQPLPQQMPPQAQMSQQMPPQSLPPQAMPGQTMPSQTMPHIGVQAQGQLPVQHPSQMPDPFSSLQPSYPNTPSTMQPQTPDFAQHPPMLSSSVASSMQGSLPGSHPGTPFSPSNFNEPSWPAGTGAGDTEDPEQMSLNQKNMLKWKDDEALGLDATISPVLYANTQHPELKTQYPDWSERCKQISRLWRRMNTEQRTPYLVEHFEQKARENRHKRAKQNKNARKRQQKENAANSPRGGGMSPGVLMKSEAVDSSSAAEGQFPPHQALAADSQGGSGAPPTPGTPADPLVADAEYKRQSHGPLPDQFRQDVFAQQQSFAGAPGPKPSGDFVPGKNLETPAADPNSARDSAANASYPGPFTKRLTMLSQRVQSQDKQAHLHVVNKQQLLAGLAMNTDDVRKQHLRELLAGKPSTPAAGTEATEWNAATNPALRQEFSIPPGPSGYPAQRTWGVDNSPSVRPFGPRQDGWPGTPSGQHLMRPPRNKFPRMDMASQAMLRARGVHPGRQQAPPHMMSEGGRMPGRMAGPQSMTPYPESYQPRMNMPGRMMEGQMGGLDTMAGRSGDVPQEILDDILTNDGQFGLLPLNDPMLDETLAEIHDKNMFDEHLGLMKEMVEDLQAESSQSDQKDQSADKTLKSDTPPKTPKAEPGSVSSSCTQSSSSTAAVTTPTAASSSANPTSTSAPTQSPVIAAKDSPGAKASPAVTTVVASIATSTTQSSETAKAGGKSSRPSSALGSPRVPPTVSGSPHQSVSGAVSPHPLAAASPHSNGHQTIPPSPHAVSMTVPGSPHPQGSTAMVPGSPHPMAGMVPASPLPTGAMVPSSPHPMASAGGPMSRSPHPFIAGVNMSGSPHSHPNPSLVPDSPRSTVLQGSSPHQGISGPGMPGASPQHQMAVQSPVAGSMEARPYSRQGSVDQAMFQRPASDPRMPYHGGITHLPVSAPKSSSTFHPIPAAYTSLHMQMHGQPRSHIVGPGHAAASAAAAPNPYSRMVESRSTPTHPLHDLLEEEKRQQLSKQESERDGRSSATLLSDQDFENLKADMVNDPPVAPCLPPQTSPRARFDPHQMAPQEMWHQQPISMSSEFPPPPPPPYPGTGRMTPGGHMRGPYMPDHRPPMSPMHPQAAGGRMPMMPGHSMQDRNQEEMLRGKESEIKERFTQKEKELNSLKKRKKTLMNRQKTLKNKNEELTPQDASLLDKIANQDIPLVSKEVDALRTEMKNHQRIIQEFNMKIQERMMHWGNPMMHRFPNYPGMMHPRMRAMYGQSRPMDPRQYEMERQHRMRMMMHGPRSNMHPMQRPPYAEGSMDHKSAMYGGPRFPGIPPRLPLKSDGSEMNEEEKRHFMAQQSPAIVRPGMRPMTPEMVAMMHQPQQIQPPYPAGTAKAREATPNPGIQRQKSAPAPKSSSATSKQPSKDGSAANANEAAKKKRQRRRRASLTLLDDLPEKSSLHTATIPTSFAGQHLYPPPKPIVSAIPFTADKMKQAPTAVEDIPKEAMTSLGNQYPLKLVKTEPKPESKADAKPEETDAAVEDSKTKPPVPASSPATSKNESTKPATSTAKTSTAVAVSADGSTLEGRIQATIDAVAQQAGEMAEREERMEKESRKEAEKRAMTGFTAAGNYSDVSLASVASASVRSVDTGVPDSPTPSVKQEMGSYDMSQRMSIPVSVVTSNVDRGAAGPLVDGAIQRPHPPLADGQEESASSNALLKRLLENVQPPAAAVKSSDNTRNVLANITPEEQRQMGSSYAPPYDPYPWNAQTGVTPDAWMRLSKKERQHVYEARLTANGRIISDNGTIISVPGSARPNPTMMMMPQTNLSMKAGPLHAMQNMRSALVGEHSMPPQPHPSAVAPKKKRPPQGDKKKKPKVNSPGIGTGASPPSRPPVIGPPVAAPGVLTEPARLYEELKQKVASLPTISLQEPLLTASDYLEILQPVKPLRLPNQRSAPKPPGLSGVYGRACIEGRFDLYSYSPYTNIQPPSLLSASTILSDSPAKKAGAGKSPKTTEASQSTDVYDISRFQKTMTKTQMLDLSLPSPPVLQPRQEMLGPASPTLLVDRASPESVDESVMTERGRRDINYPYLKPIKPSTVELPSPLDDGRTSPDIPVHAPVPIKVAGFGRRQKTEQERSDMSAKDRFKSDPFGSMAEEELKSTAVGIQSSLQSAIRESPSNQVSVTLTLTSEAAQDIPNVLSKLADLLRMAAPPTSYQVNPADKDGKKAVIGPSDGKPHVCAHCEQLVPSDSSVVKGHKSPTLSTSQSLLTDREGLHFCGEDCLVQYTLSRQQSAEAGKRAYQHLKLRELGSLLTDHKPTDLKSLANKSNQKKPKRKVDITLGQELVKKWKGKRWRRWDIKVTFDLHKYEPPTEEDVKSTLRKVGQLVRPESPPPDTRTCILCSKAGDGENHVASRLLNHDVDRWVHLNCALWSTEVYETLNGALMNLNTSIKRGAQLQCVACGLKGATMGCFKPRCTNIYHVACAHERHCMFFQDKTVLCPLHMPSASPEQLKDLTVSRKVYINRDESLQIANAVRSDDKPCCVRIGAVVYYSIGQLFTHQILTGKFHTRDYIYPVGYRCVRFFWSTRYPNKRCCYECSIAEEGEGAPVFIITVKEPGHNNTVYKDDSPKAVWSHILSVVEARRKERDCVKLFPEFLSGEYMFGLKETAIIRIIESLPGTELLAGYAFKFGKTQLIEMPPAINPTGCARAEPKLRTHFRKPHTLQASSSRATVLPSMTTVALPGDVNSPYHKQFVHSKSQQYRKLKNEWRNYVYLGRSRIQGLGMFAARDIEKHTMVIEYIGEVIRNELAEYREKIYEEHNRGVYMFRITPDFVIDATMSGGPARYINHSCDPNCVTETVPMDKDVKIVIIALRRISKGEELNYDYKFDLEDDSSKIPCNCGASNCRKWMN